MLLGLKLFAHLQSSTSSDTSLRVSDGNGSRSKCQSAIKNMKIIIRPCVQAYKEPTNCVQSPVTAPRQLILYNQGFPKPHLNPNPFWSLAFWKRATTSTSADRMSTLSNLPACTGKCRTGGIWETPGCPRQPLSTLWHNLVVGSSRHKGQISCCPLEHFQFLQSQLPVPWEHKAHSQRDRIKLKVQSDSGRP